MRSLLSIIVVGAVVLSGCRKKDAPAEKPDSAHHHEGICEKHHLPEDRCPFCDPSLVEKWGQCGEHQVPEALCWICNPKLIAAYQAERDWCAEHEMPESRCTLCNPELTETPTAVAPSANPTPVRVETVTNPSRSQQPPNDHCTLTQQRVRLASMEIAAQAGLEYVPIQKISVTHSLLCQAEVVFNQNRYAHLIPRVPGTIGDVLVDLGQVVTLNQPLVKIDSAEFTSAQADYLQALALVNLWQRNHEQESALVEKGISSARDGLEAETRLAEQRIVLSRARQKLESLGMTKEQIEKLATSESADPQYIVTSPLEGVIVERHSVVGELAALDKPLLAIADTSVMWAMLDVYENDLAQVAVGQTVTLSLDGLRGETFRGTITWISTQVDPQTRTLKVRAELDNTGGLLRANMYGKALIIVYDQQPLLVVPKSAVQWDGCCNIVFVQSNNDLYEPRKVRLGYEASEYFVVLDGLAEGETVVTQGSFLLKTEIMKGSIGAGCCETGGKKH
ncbi:MAG: Multidrug resistance protein MdtA [Phycisphaerae bacterium]|nr:Multidrug resistance protein MdtA [Phycisphaerae bacterium]